MTGLVIIQQSIDIKAENLELRGRVKALESEMDRANQISRRNSARVSGIPEGRDENTDTRILNIANSIGADVIIEEIDRSHRVGQPRIGRSVKPRDILVKSYYGPFAHNRPQLGLSHQLPNC